MNIQCRVYRHTIHVHVATYRTHIHMNSLTLTRRRGSGQHPEQRPDNRPLVRPQPNLAPPGDNPHSPRSHHTTHTHSHSPPPKRPHPANPTTSSGRRVNRQWPCPSHNQLLAAPLHYPLLPPDLSRATHPVTASTTANANVTTITCSTMFFAERMKVLKEVKQKIAMVQHEQSRSMRLNGGNKYIIRGPSSHYRARRLYSTLPQVWPWPPFKPLANRRH